MPEYICDGARDWIRSEAMFEGVPENKFRYPEIVPVTAGDIQFLEHRKDLAFEAFDVKHSIPAMGGTLYYYKKKLKDEYLGLSADEIIQLRKQGIEITREVYDPLVSFMGDCMGESLLENYRVFQSKVLITECTFLAPEDYEMSHKKGHTHIRQIADALNRMGDRVECEKIILAHFSMKYSEKYIREMIAKEIPEQFLDKIVAFI
jgi:ribonuclease Z